MHIDTLAYTNRLCRLPPAHKLGFALVLLAIAYVTPVSIQLLILGWVSIWVVIYAKVPTFVYLRLLWLTAIFWLSSVPAIVLNVVGMVDRVTVRLDSLWGWQLGDYYLYVSQQGLVQAGELGARTIATSACMYLILLTVPFVALLDIFRRWGCPTLLTELLFLMYRFIFILLDTARELWIAQNARGGYRTRRLWMHSVSLLVGQLLRRTLVNYQQVSLSLAARGFNGEFQVWHSRSYQPSRRYSWEAAIGCTILITLAGWMHVIRVRSS
jgi:cobalt/nickel transport system permease protein